MPSAIIDNKTRLLVDAINEQLVHTVKAKVAVGYFFLSGLKAIQDKLDVKDENGEYIIKEVRLLIGNTTNRQTVEELARSFRLTEHIQKQVEKLKRPGSGEKKLEKDVAQQTIRTVISDLDQTEENSKLLETVFHMVNDDRLKVKVYIKSRLHAKAYIFDFIHPQPNSKGIAIVGSSNLSLAGLTNNTELNVFVHDNGENHDELTTWFKNLWDDAEDFDEQFLEELEESWGIKEVTPEDIYYKTIYTLLKDRLEGEDEKSFLWTNELTEQLASFQEVAVKQLIGIINDFGGAFAADVVGVGKSYIGAAVVKHFTLMENAKPLIICPKALEEMWKTYNGKYSLNAEVVSSSMLREGDNEDDWNYLLNDSKYNHRNFILIDESHHFRHHGSQRYQVLSDFIQTGKKKVLLMTATPRNNSAKDVLNQIKLFHPDDLTEIPINPPSLKEYFKPILKPETPREDANHLFQQLLQFILVRRTRLHILKYYGFDEKTNKPVDPKLFTPYISGEKRAYIKVGGNKNFFPVRKVDTVGYSIADTYQGLYQDIRTSLGKVSFDHSQDPHPDQLTYARFALWHYVKPEWQDKEPYRELHRAGANLRGLMRILMFKRFESSVYAFRMTIGRMINIHTAYLNALDKNIIPAGKDAQQILYGSDKYSEEDLITALEGVAQQYDAEKFDLDRLENHIEHDLGILNHIFSLVNENEIPPEKDAKLQKLKNILSEKPLDTGKVLIFSESAETVDYLHTNMNPKDEPSIRKASTGNDNKSSLVNRFAPIANDYSLKPNEIEINMMMATDVLAEGLNMQDCDKIINYDLHWNPVKLIQRFGRIDRIGSTHDEIFGFNFLPETELDKNLNLHEIVHNRIQDIHDTIGEDAKILDDNEQINEDEMYAIYERDVKQLALFEEKMEKESISFNEAEEELRKMKKENPDKFEEIRSLRDGIRCSVSENGNTQFVFCQADRYSQLYLVNRKGDIVEKEVIKILGMLKGQFGKLSQPVSNEFNDTLQKVKDRFVKDVVNRYLEQRHSRTLNIDQRYLKDELQKIYQSADNENLKGQVELFEDVFLKIQRPAVLSEIKKLRKNNVTNRALLDRLTEIWGRHSLNEVSTSNDIVDEVPPIPKIVCGETVE